MDDTKKQKRAAYDKVYRAANREKRAAQNKKWREDNAEAYAAYQARYRDENREKRNADAKLRAKAYPEKVRQWKQAWTAANVEHVKATQARWRASNPDKVNGYRDRWRAANPEKYTAYQKRYRQENAARIRKWIRDWTVANHDKVVTFRANNYAARRARLRSKPAPGITTEQWAEILETFGHVCAYCLCPGKLTRDHVIPIARGGLDQYDNIVPACRSCNCSKGTKLLASWYADKRCSIAA